MGRGPAAFEITLPHARAWTLLFSTYLGASGDDAMETHGLAIDADGQPIVTGDTNSPDFPTTDGAFQRRPGSRFGTSKDGSIAKLSADGSRLLASTYLGGRRDDWLEGVAVAPDGAIVVTGGTASHDFPITRNALQSELQAEMLILTKVDMELAQIWYRTLFGGDGEDAGRAIALAERRHRDRWPDRLGNFPVLRSFDQSLSGDRASAYVRLTPISK